LKTKYEQNFSPTPNLSDSDVNVMIARANLETLLKKRFVVPVDKMVAGYTDGKVQIINRVGLSYSTTGWCGDQGNLHGSPSLSYTDKLELEAAAKATQDDRSQATIDLGKSL
jgi:hypothetical protein